MMQKLVASTRLESVLDSKYTAKATMHKLAALVTIERLIAGIIYALFAMLPALIVIVTSRSNPESYFLYFVAPMFCAFIAAFFLSPNLAGTNHGLVVCVLSSILIVIVSIILWLIPAIIFLPKLKIENAMGLGLAIGTYFGWAVYPPGIVAGIITQVFMEELRSKKNKIKLSK